MAYYLANKIYVRMFSKEMHLQIYRSFVGSVSSVM